MTENKNQNKKRVKLLKQGLGEAWAVSQHGFLKSCFFPFHFPYFPREVGAHGVLVELFFFTHVLKLWCKGATSILIRRRTNGQGGCYSTHCQYKITNDKIVNPSILTPSPLHSLYYYFFHTLWEEQQT